MSRVLIIPYGAPNCSQAAYADTVLYKDWCIAWRDGGDIEEII